MIDFKKIFIPTIVIMLGYNNSFALTPKSKQIYAGLKQLVEIFEPDVAKMYNKHNVSDEDYVLVFDYCCKPDSSIWTNRQYKDFNLEFGIYYIDGPEVYMLTHHDSIYIYKSDNMSDIRFTIIKHIISIIKNEPDLISQEVYFNITENLFYRSHGCRFSFIKYKDEYIDFGTFNLYLDSKRLINIFEERTK